MHHVAQIEHINMAADQRVFHQHGLARVARRTMPPGRTMVQSSSLARSWVSAQFLARSDLPTKALTKGPRPQGCRHSRWR